MVREEPYPDLTCEWYRSESGGTRKGAHTGVARLSSARVVRCWVKSRNERNPRGLLYLSDPTAERNSEEGDRKSTGLDSSHQIISYAVFCLKKNKVHGITGNELFSPPGAGR